MNSRTTITSTIRISAAAVVLILSVATFAQRKEFPGRHNMIDVTRSGAIPTDQLSDQAAIVAAIAGGGNFPNPRVIYFPAGTYIVDSVLDMGGNHGANVNCCVTFQGQGPGVTVIKLKDNAAGFGNAASPKSMIITEAGNMSFRYNIFDLTVEIGTGNAGAMAVDYIVNNQGAIENVEIKADGDAFVGLEMTRQWPGPCLIKDVTIRGFAHGIRAGAGQYGVTFENITLEGQTNTGLNNVGNFVAVHRLTSTNTVPAVRGGYTILVDADLHTPTGKTSTGAAVVITSGSMCYARNVTATGYAAAISYNGANVAQNPITEYSSVTAVNTLNGDSWGSLKLPIKNSPDFHDNDTSNWVCTADHLEAPAAGGTGYASLKKAIEYAAANGKSTVYARQQGQTPYPIFSSPIIIPPQVKNLVGFQSQINPPTGTRANIIITGNTTDPLVIEGWRFSGVTIHDESTRPVVIKHCQVDTITSAAGAGDLFIEDMETKLYFQYPQRVYLRQFNPEDLSGTGRIRINNAGAQVWILGLKTEGVGNIITTSNNGSTELLGVFVYPVNQDNLGQPAFTVTDACMTAMFAYAGGYQTIWRETRDGVTKNLAGATANSAAMYVANKGCPTTGVEQEPAPKIRLSSAIPRSAKVSSVTMTSRVILPANAAGFALFDMRGDKVWQFMRASGGDMRVAVPRSVSARGIAVVKYLRN